MKAAATLEEIYVPVEARLQAVPQTILDILGSPNDLAGDVIAYFFSGKGKLLRPALTCLGAAVKEKDTVLPPDFEARLLKLAASFEIFHGATLIHDDIIDASYLRRNIPTINHKWGPEVAVLVGDYLHDKAIGTIHQNGTEKIFKLFVETAGIVCDGEIHELQEKNNLRLTEESYLKIIEKKTASLLACTLKAGGLLAGANEEESRALYQFGIDFGIAFQIVDDCLDFSGNEDEFGKTLGADFAGGVLTLPLIRLLSAADGPAKEEALEIFKGRDESKLQKILQMIRDYAALDYALDRARAYSDSARARLAIFPESAARASLERLVDYVLERNR